MTRVFVFGSNLAGRHGKGAALAAKLDHGARQGCGRGHYGNSYAIPTKDYNIRTLPLETVRHGVAEFLAFAAQHPELQFDITPIGCGLAGFKRSQIEPLFAGMPSNCHFTASWADHKD